MDPDEWDYDGVGTIPENVGKGLATPVLMYVDEWETVQRWWTNPTPEQYVGAAVSCVLIWEYFVRPAAQGIKNWWNTVKPTRLPSAYDIAKKPIESVTDPTKIQSQLDSKRTLLGLPNGGNPNNMNDPVVRQMLDLLDEISANPTRIWAGVSSNNAKVYEYIRDGIGVIRDRYTGTLISVYDRTTPDKMLHLQNRVDQGTATWIK